MLPVILINHGTIKHIHVIAALHLDQFKMENVFVQPQRLYGTLVLNHVNVLQIRSDKIVSSVLLPDYGTLLKTNVSVHHPKLNGINQHKNVNVQLENMGILVLNVHHQDSGMKNKKVVYVQPQQLYGTQLIQLVFAPQGFMDLSVRLV